jgi:hypothetical protein
VTDESELPPLQVTVDTHGHPGSWRILFIGRVSEDLADNYLNITRLRRFEARAMFTKGDPPPTEGQVLTCDPKNGASYIRFENGLWISPSAVGNIRFFTNDVGEMSYADMAFDAEGYVDARNTFTSLLYRRLDRLSFEHNVPVSVSVMALRDVSLAIDSFAFIYPYNSGKFMPNQRTLSREASIALSLYREAKNSHSSAYKLLNYYKIMELIQNSANPRLRKIALAKGITIDQRDDRVPDGDYSKDVKPYIGKKIKDFRLKFLREKCRNSIAHSLLDDKVSGKKIPPLDLGAALEIHTLDALTVPAEDCARRVVENHLHLWDQIRSGTAESLRRQQSSD